MIIKPYKEVNTWKRHDIKVFFVDGNGEDEEVLKKESLKKLNSLDDMKMIILFDGGRVYESNVGSFAVKEFSYRLLKRRGIFFKTVNYVVDVLAWNDEQDRSDCRHGARTACL